MNFKLVMTIQAVALVYFGVGSLLFPEQIWEGLYGLQVEGEGLWILRIAAGLGIGNLVLSWVARNAEDSEARRAVITFFMIDWSIFGLISLWGQLQGAYNALNWTNVLIAALWAGIFAYFRFGARTASMANYAGRVQVE